MQTYRGGGGHSTPADYLFAMILRSFGRVQEEEEEEEDKEEEKRSREGGGGDSTSVECEFSISPLP